MGASKSEWKTTERIFDMMKYLCRVRYAPMPKLAEMYGVSVRTIKRDVDVLGSLIPLETRLGRYEGGVYVISGLKDYRGELIYFEEGDASRFFVKKYPELVMVFSKVSEIDLIIDDWVCTCYERRILYFVDINNIQSFIDALFDCKFDTSVCYDKVWSLVDCIIENSPEAPDHDTFVVVSKSCLSAK